MAKIEKQMTAELLTIMTCLLIFTIIFNIIIHQTHYEKSDWLRAFNQFTIACELMSSSTSAWLLSPLECSPQKQNG